MSTIFAAAVSLSAAIIAADAAPLTAPAANSQANMSPMSAEDIEKVIVGRTIDESPYGPDQSGLTFLPNGQTHRDGFAINIPGRYRIAGNRITVTEQLRQGTGAAFSIEFYITADRTMLYRYANSGRNDPLRPLRLK